MKTTLSFLLTFTLLLSCGKEGAEKQTKTKKSNSPQYQANTGSDDHVSYLPHSIEGAETFITQKKMGLETDSRYWAIWEESDPTQSKLNYQSFPSGVRQVTIKGRKIVFKKDSPQKLYEQLKETYDMASIVIEADTIEIHEPLLWHQADVTIKAKNLKFIKDGKISTTPDNLNFNAEQFQDGETGLTAGSIVISINQFENHSNQAIIFDLNGGNGQAAGSGQDGTKGTSVKSISKKEKAIVYLSIEKCDTSDPFPGIYLDKKFDCITTIKGSPIWPTNGQNAAPGGKPGEPGNGGSLYTNVQIDEKYIQLSGGSAGESAGSYKGGEAGTPTHACHVFKSSNQKKDKQDCKNTSVGADIQSPTPLSQFGSVGKLSVDKNIDWQNDGMSEFNSRYIQDLHLSGRADEAKSEILEFKSNFENSWRKSVLTKNNLLKIETILFQIESHLDFYGQKATWVPNLSLESNYKAYEVEIERTFKSLYLIYWIQNSQKSIESRIQTLEQLEESLKEQIINSSSAISSFNEKIPLLKKKIEDHRVIEQEFRRELKRLEREIAHAASKNLEVPFMKKAVGMIAAMSKAIPIGQPTFSAVGSGLDLLYSTFESDKPWDKILESLPEAIDIYKNVDFEKSSKDWNARFSKVKLSRFMDSKTKKERKQYLSDLEEFSAPIIKELGKQITMQRKNEVPRSALQAEILKIKNSHPIYKNIIKKLEKLLASKAFLEDEAQGLTNGITQNINKISNTHIQLIEISQDTSRDRNSISPEAIRGLNEIKEELIENLRLYHYRMARSFEYRLLKPYQGSLNLYAIFEKMQLLVSESNVNSLSSSEFLDLKSIYEIELSKILNEVLNDVESSGGTYSKDVTIHLTPAEINALNSDQTIFLNLTSSELFGKESSNIRINSIEIENIETRTEGIPQRIASAQIDVYYNGESYLEKNNRIFIFEHESKTKAKDIRWGAIIDVLTKSTSPITPSWSEKSLLSSLLDLDIEKSLFLSRPGARANYGIQFKSLADNKSEIKLETVALKFNIDYQRK